MRGRLRGRDFVMRLCDELFVTLNSDSLVIG